MAKLSVIMPVYNAEKYLSIAIESVLNQSFSDFEFLIIDDCSTDKSVEIVNSYNDSRIHFFQNKENMGSLKSRNLLFSKVKGKYFCFQDADDFSVRNRFELLVSFMESNTNVYLCGSNTNFYNDEGKLTFTSNTTLDTGQLRTEFKNKAPILFATSIVRAEVLTDIGVFREYFYDLGNYDYDWMCRISEKFDCSNLSDILYNVNRHGDSNSLTVGNPYKIIGHEIVQFLARERAANNGKDSLMTGEIEKIENFATKQYAKYLKDPSLYLYNQILGLLSENMYQKAFKLSLKAIKINPLCSMNYRTSFYIVRKWLRYNLSLKN